MKQNKEKEIKIKNKYNNFFSFKNIVLSFFILVVIIVGLFWGGKWLHYRLTHAVTDDAFIEADLVNIAPLVSGHVVEVLTEEARPVKAGELLARIDDKDISAQLAIIQNDLERAREMKNQASIKIEKARTALELTKAEVKTAIEVAKADLNAAKARFVLATKDEERFRSLLKENAIAKRKYDEVKAGYDQAKEAVKAAQAALKRALALKKRIMVAKKDYEAAKEALNLAIATIKVAKSRLSQAKLNLSHTLIKAPQDGIIAKKFVNPGDFVVAGQPIFSIYDPKKVYVIANLEETKIKGVKIGSPVYIRIDAFPDLKLQGEVSRITPAASAKFALIPRDVTAGEFTKVVQRIPIKITIRIPEGIILVPGMSVEVGIARSKDR